MSAVELVDAEVRTAIRTRLHESLCVEAGAGTGKTTVLVDRIVEALARGEATVDELAVITFTEKAAGELTARVREALERREPDEPDPAARERLRGAGRDLHRAHLQTIHAFCADLLRERPLEAGLDPAFEVLDGAGAEVEFEQAYRAWLAGELAGDHPDLERALNRGFDLRELRQAADALQRHRALVTRPLPPPEPVLLEGVVAEVQAAAQALEALGLRCSAPDTDRGFALIAPVVAFAQRLAGAGDAAERERVLLFEAPTLRGDLGARKAWPQDGDCAELKARLAELRALLETTTDALRAEALAGVLPHVAGFVARAAQARRRRGQATFEDLLLWARDLVRDLPEVRAHFAARFRLVLVDEFQDTDPVQAELVAWLTSDGSADAGGDWRALRPGPGRLVVVGDPKQSIYRFRGADIAVYDAVKAGPLTDRVLEIRQNFRSLPGVLDWVNGVFDRVLVGEPGVQPANVRLEPHAEAHDADGRPAVVVVRAQPDDASAGGVRQAEADLLAALLHRLVREEAWPVRRRDGSRGPVRWRDCALLFPWRTGIERYEAALARLDIPFRLEGSRTFYARQEVRELVSILLALDDPTDRISLVAALRSGAASCSDAAIFAWVTAGGALDYRFGARAAGPDAPPEVAEALATLLELHRASRGTTLPELVGRVLERTRLVEAALALPGGAQAAANLLKVAEQAREFSATGGGGLRAFARFLARQRDEENPEADAGVADESDDVVRLMTFHAAKGLEFPVVALANLNSDPPPRTIPVRDPAEARLHLRVGTADDGYFATPGFDAAMQRERELIVAERRRWLYVGATRARDHLVVPVVAARRPGRLLQELRPDLPPEEAEPGRVDGGCLTYDAALLAGAQAPPVAPVPAPGDAEVRSALEARAAWEADRHAVLAHAGAEREVRTPTGSEPAWAPQAAVVPDEAAGDGLLLTTGQAEGREVGDALHRVLELVDLPAARELDAVVARVCAEGGLPGQADEVAALARRCLASPTVRRAIASGRARREVAFMLAEPDGALLSGRIDLVFREGDELGVVDFKTDSVPAAALTEHVRRHEGQAQAYAQALRRLTGLEVREVVFVFARAGEERAVAV